MSRITGVRRALFVGVFVGIFLAVASPASSARTLFYWPTQIQAFAQDGPYVAWIARAPNKVSPSCGRTYVRSLESGRQGAFGTKDRPVCVRITIEPGHLALGRGRALWRALPIPNDCGNCIPEGVFTASLADPTVSRLGTFVYLAGGRQLTALAADWGLLAFSFVRYKEIVIGDCFCKWDVTGGRAAQVLGGDRHFLPAVSPPALLAAGAGRIAVAPTADPWDGPENPPQPTENGPVNVLDPSTSTLVMSVSPTGTVRALALSAGALAVLVERTDGSLIIERYAIPAGTLISTPVDANAAFEELDISGKWIVYRVRRQIRIVDDLGGDHLLIEAPARPIGISIERGRRVAWAENTGQTHRIRAALTPLSRMSPSR